MSNNNTDLSPDTLAWMRLTESITENNNTVSGTMHIMSENIEEMSRILISVEEKLDQNKMILHNHCKVWSIENEKIVIEFIKKLNEAGFAEFLLRAKKFWKVLIVTIFASISIALIKWIYDMWQLFRQFLASQGG